MKPISYSRGFQKNLKRRFGRQPKVLGQFRERAVLFQQCQRGATINDHQLRGGHGLRWFSVSGDIRVIYRETSEFYEFLDIGTHNQVYGG